MVSEGTVGGLSEAETSILVENYGYGTFIISRVEGSFLDVLKKWECFGVWCK